MALKFSISMAVIMPASAFDLRTQTQIDCDRRQHPSRGSHHQEEELHTTLMVRTQFAEMVVQHASQPVIAEDNHHASLVVATDQVLLDLLDDVGETDRFH